MRAYMHGYFVDNRLWHKARALAEPFAYDTYCQQRVQQKMEQERKSRIGIVKKLPKVRMQMLYLHSQMHCSLCICIIYLYRHMVYSVAQLSYYSSWDTFTKCLQDCTMYISHMFAI